MGFFDFIGDIFEPSQKNATTTTNSSHTANPNYQPYGGPLLPNLSDLSQLASDRTYARVFNGSPTLKGANSYTADVLGGKYLNKNPYLDATFNNAASRVGDQFRTATAPQIAASHSLMGRFNSGAQRNTEATARGGLGDTLNRLATDIYGGDYAAERGRMDSAAGRAPVLNQADFTDTNEAAKLGAYFNSFYDLQTQRQRQDWYNNQTIPYQTGGSMGTTTTPQFGNSPFETALGIGATVAPFFISDRRLKTEIKRIGELRSGLPLYTFRYKFGGPVHIGVMADEAEKIMPAAVKEFFGYKHVNYAMLGG